MKLKKIASLALAGIMAVSMLAGCKDGGNGNSGSSSSETTVSVGYASNIYNALNSKSKELIQTKSDSIINNVATAMVAAYNPNWFSNIEGRQDAVVGTIPTNPTMVNVLNTAARKELSADYKLITETDLADDEYVSKMKDGNVAVVVMVGDHSLTEATMINQIADVINDNFANISSNSNNADTKNYYLSATKVTTGSGNSQVDFVVIGIEYELVKAA